MIAIAYKILPIPFGPLISLKLSSELGTSPSLKAFKAQIQNDELSSYIDNATSYIDNTTSYVTYEWYITLVLLFLLLYMYCK